MAEVLMLEEVPAAEPIDVRFEVAAELLEKAAASLGSDPQALYMLALAHKRQGKLADARAALRKIARPDANVFLQMGLLSLREGQTAQAEQEFARAWQMTPASFAAGHNFLLSRLTLGQTQACLDLIPAVAALAPDPKQRRFLDILAELLRNHRPEKVGEDRALIVLPLDSPLETL